MLPASHLAATSSASGTAATTAATAGSDTGATTGAATTPNTQQGRTASALASRSPARRQAAWKPLPRRYERGYGWMFGQHILQANEGCDFDFLETSFGAPVPEPAIY